MSSQANEVRIIGGSLRGRRLKFPPIKGLRPTPNRIRETLFNWLAYDITTANCLDLFAGSGALGFEALSRGAAFVAFCEKSRALVRYLQMQLDIFQLSNAKIYHTAIPNSALHFHRQFDVVFMDPPFHQNLIAPAARWLIENRVLAKEALIYIETEAQLTNLALPTQWALQKQKVTGEVAYALYRQME